MYCRNCGKEMSELAVVCVNCGVQKGGGTAFCPNCASETTPEQVVCTNCGVSLVSKVAAAPGAKSKMAAGLLGILLGGFGVHNFYLGFTGKAIAQLSLMVVGIATSCIAIGVIPMMAASIWGLVEGIMILTGSISKDAKGNPLAD